MILSPPNYDYLLYDNAGYQSIKQKSEQWYADSITINQSFWSEADIDSRFLAGDQTLWNDIYGNLPAFRRRQFTFNRIRPIHNMIGGYQRRNRKSTIVVPLENADQQTADQFTKVMMWAYQRGDFLETISRGFDLSNTCGMCLLHSWMDYRSDPINGDIVVDALAYNEFLIDPFFKKNDLSDCNFIWRRKWLDKVNLYALLPDYTNEVDEVHGQGDRDGKFQFQPEAYNYGMKNLLSYDEIWYRTYRAQKLIVDTRTGETMEWRGDDQTLKAYLSHFPELTTVQQQVPTCNLAILVQGKVFYDGPNPMGIDQYPFVPIFAYYDPQIPYFPWRIQGVVRGLRDAQYLYNRRKVIELDILESQINSGWKFKADSLVDPREVFMQGQGRGIAIKRDANLADAEQIPAPQIPPSMIELSRILGEELKALSGVNEELLGSAVDEKSGILSMLRQGAGLTTLQILFDNLDLSQKLLGELHISMMQSNFSPGKIQKIIGEKPTLQFYSRAFGKYGASVQEGLNTSTQRQLHFAQLLQLRETGVPVPVTALLEASTLQNKRELIEQIQQQEQQQSQIQDLQIQMAVQKSQAEVKDITARAEANTGLGLERASRVQENRALALERLAASEKDRDLGVLHTVKALKELEGMDLSHIEQLLRLSEFLKERESLSETADKLQVTTPNVEEVAVATAA